MRLARQMRGHVRLAFTPATRAVLGLAAVVSAFRARNASELLHGADAATVALAGAIRIAALQMSTLFGVAVAATAAAVFSAAVPGERLMALLEPSPVRRWALRCVALVAALGAGIGVTAAATVSAGVVQAYRLDGAVRLSIGTPGDLLVHPPLVLFSIATGALLLASLLRGSPAVAAAAAVGGTYATLIVQHLAGPTGDVVVPTAWLARWLELKAADYGIAFVWTTGAGDRAACGAALAALTVALAAAGCVAIARADCG